jgi:Xaa-Pro aminopeptidase
MSMPKEECLARVARARARMRRDGVDGLVVTDPVSFYYFSGQKAGAGGIGRPMAFILPLEGDPAVVDWSGPGLFARLYRKPYPTWVEDRRIYPEVPFNREPRVDWGIRDVLVERNLARGVIGIELGNEPRLGLAVDDFARLREDLPGARWVDSGPIVWSCRMIKSDWEIDKLKKACDIGGRAWERIFGELRAGITQADIQRKAITYYLELGADLDSGPPLALGATGPGGAFRQGDILYLDGGCSVNGYKMDFTRRAVFGPPSPRQQAEHDGMWDITMKVIERMKPGVATAEIFEFSQGLVSKTPWRNYSDHPSKRIGHGIGLVNEPPYLNAFDEHVLAPGMSITPEPKIETEEGLLNAEEHVILREGGCEVISQASDRRLYVVA